MLTLSIALFSISCVIYPESESVLSDQVRPQLRGRARYVLRTSRAAGQGWLAPDDQNNLLPDGQTARLTLTVLQLPQTGAAALLPCKALWEPEEVTRFELRVSDKYLHSSTTTATVTCEQTVIPRRYPSPSCL